MTDEARPLLQVRNLRTAFETPGGRVKAVDGVTFDLAAGRTLGIVGESGSGKSVLVRTIMNLLGPNAVVGDDGQVLFDGRDVRHLDAIESRHFWGTEIAMVFQDPMTALNPVKRVGKQLTESMRFHLGCSKSEARERALGLLRQVGIPEPERRLGQYPHELSGGMRQRVAIAIAIACSPRLLIADEPTTALDVTVQRQILDLLDRLRRETGMAMILITHDLGVVAGHADEVAVMYAGTFVEQAPTEELFAEVEHPYTSALLASIPRADLPSHTPLAAIVGRPPNMIDPPPGCRFAPRCAYRTDDCELEMPMLEPLRSPSHTVRCIHPLGDARPVAATPVQLDGSDR